MPTVAICWLATLAVLGCFGSPAHAQDWPQILGANRDGQITSSKFQLADQWPSKLEPVWERQLGSGYGGAAIVDGTVLVMDRSGNQEALNAFALKDGSVKWKQTWPASYSGGYNPDAGPRCVPTVSGGRVFCYGAAGDLVAVSLDSGQLLWRRQLRKEYDADDGYFGAGSSPLVDGETVIVCLGGEQAGIVGVSADSGETLWKATDYDASYASPILLSATENRALVVTRYFTVLLDTTNGQVKDEIRFGARGPTVNAATPIRVSPNQYLLTASYGVGCTLIEIKNESLETIMAGEPILSSQYNTPIFQNGKVIGIDGREDIGVAALVSINPESKRVVWRETGFGTAHLLASPARVLALGLRGELSLLDASADEFIALAKVQLPSGVYRAVPAISDGKLVARSGEGRGSKLYCIQLPGQR